MGRRPQLMVLFNLELAVKAGSKGYCSVQLMISQCKAVFAGGRIPSALLMVAAGLSSPLQHWEVQPGY